MKTLSLAVASLLIGAHDVLPQTGTANAHRRIAVGVIEPIEWKRDPANAGSIRGLTLGIEESTQTARLFGWEVVLVRAPDSLSGGEAFAFLARRDITAIVGDLGGLVSQYPRSTSAPIVLDIGRRGAIAVKRCGDGRFHLLPDAGLTDADNRALLAWHPSLERFGAGELNERYRRRFGEGMDELAWAGWMATKVLIDAALKRGTTTPAELETFLVNTARFDGHKGVPLYFDRERRELVQPLFALRRVESADVVDQVEPQPRPASNGGAGCQLP